MPGLLAPAPAAGSCCWLAAAATAAVPVRCLGHYAAAARKNLTFIACANELVRLLLLGFAETPGPPERPPCPLLRSALDILSGANLSPMLLLLPQCGHGVILAPKPIDSTPVRVAFRFWASL